jgi:hypothetical protein
LLIVTLFAGYGLGRLSNGGTSVAPPAAGTGMAGAGMTGMPLDESRPHTHNADGAVTQGGTTAGMSMAAAAGGLATSQGGLTMVPATTTFQTGHGDRLSFTITGAGGAPVTTYAVVHDKPLHPHRGPPDLSGYQHLHPTMTPDGT